MGSEFVRLIDKVEVRIIPSYRYASRSQFNYIQNLREISQKCLTAAPAWNNTSAQTPVTKDFSSSTSSVTK